MPITAWFFITAALTAEALKRDNCTLAVLAGVAFGLALVSKINALFLPVLLVPWALLWRRRQWKKLVPPLLIIRIGQLENMIERLT
jgi:4-amino-4-deoxy-L-arabinose transferase-like glycosyltransferase